MPALVPLTSPVKTMTGARALAETISHAASTDAPVGPAIDRVLRYLNELPYADLRRQTEGVLDVLHLLGRRAYFAADWLARWSQDVESTRYWFELRDLLGLARAA
jgi:hypothetical protein